MFSRLRRQKFARVLTKDEDSENLLSSSSSSIQFKTDEPKSESNVRVAVKTTILCTIVYFTVGLWMAFSVRNERFVSNVDEFCINHISLYSPMVKEVKPNWHTVRFNGSFLHENIYRQSAGPEVDAAWEALGVDYRSVVIPLDEAEKTGLRPDQVKVSPVYGGGYPANVEGLHHLHCLNLLRKALKWNYDYYKEQGKGPFTNSEYIVRYHVTHCLDILRQTLMCTPDVGVLGQVWWKPSNEGPQPFVDFNTKHRCRDFEAIRKWAKAHQLPPEEEVDMSIFYQMPKPGDTVYAEIP